MADKYIIRCTVGSEYNVDTHSVVSVNTSEPTRISTDLMDAEVWVRVEGYTGLPRGSPSTSAYFSQEPHATNGDRYSIAMRFTPKKPKESPDSDSDSSQTEAKGISGQDLQFGNDFDNPIRDRLPPGFSYAMNIVKWWIDPGLDGDPYADKPYLYGPALSSVNCLHVGKGEVDAEKGGLVVEEGGGSSDDDEWRKAVGAPDTSKARMKWALRDDSKKAWQFEYGRTYCADFFNPYIDFSDFSLRLPGFHVPIMKYWDGQSLRYVLRNRSTDDTYLVVLFTLYLKEDVNEDGSLKPNALAGGGALEAGEAAAVPTAAGAAPEDDKGAADYDKAKEHFEKKEVDAGDDID